MIPLFLGLTAANLICLVAVFFMGSFVTNAEGVYTDAYNYHVTFAVFAGLFATMTHVAAYTYFMATSRWLGAAADKANLSIAEYVAPSLARKRRAFFAMTAAIVSTMLAMFSGAIADAGAASNTPPLLPDGTHMLFAVVALGANLACSVAEYRLIKQQGMLMDTALETLNQQPASSAEQL